MANQDKGEAALDQVAGFIRSGWDYLGMDRRLEVSKQFAMDHPIMTLFMLVTIAMCSIPIFCFVAFVFGSMVLTFAGFIFLESTVLTIAAVLLGGVLFLVSLFSVGFSAFIVLAFYLLSLGQTMIQSAVVRYHQMTEASNVSNSEDGGGDRPEHDGNGAIKT